MCSQVPSPTRCCEFIIHSVDVKIEALHSSWRRRTAGGCQRRSPRCRWGRPRAARPAGPGRARARAGSWCRSAECSFDCYCNKYEAPYYITLWPQKYLTKEQKYLTIMNAYLHYSAPDFPYQRRVSPRGGVSGALDLHAAAEPEHLGAPRS